MAKRNKQEKDALDNIIDQLDLNGVTQEELFGEDGLVKALTSRILNKALQAEMDNHLGYQKNDSAGNNSGNNRNGYSTKKVMTQDQEVELSIPRDRNGEFSPVLVPKYEKRLPIFNEQIIALYSSGMTVRDIQAHLQDMYGVEVSAELVSRVTDSILTEVRSGGTGRCPLLASTLNNYVSLDIIKMS